MQYTFSMPLQTPDLEVKLKTELSKAIIEGKTSVPFKTFVALVLQRKVLPLFKKWGDEPIVVNSELLTSIASASQDSQENRAQLVLVTLGVGVLVGVFAFAIFQIILGGIGITLGIRELLLITAMLLGIALLASILSRVQRKNRAQKIADTMEKVANLLS